LEEILSLKLQTEERHKYGISTKLLLQLNQKTTTNLGISKMLVKQTTCKCGALTLVGSKYSNTKTTNLSTGKIIRFLMLRTIRTKKVTQLVFLETTEANTNNGQLPILMKCKMKKLKVSTKTSVSTLTGHFTLFQDCQ